MKFSANDIRLVGKKREDEFKTLIHKHGYFVHMMETNNEGQPFDFVTSKENISYFLDIKNVNKGKRLVLDRIEPNQRSSFKMLNDFNTLNTLIVAYFKELNNWYYIEFRHIDFEKSSINIKEFKIIDFNNKESVDKIFLKNIKKGEIWLCQTKK